MRIGIIGGGVAGLGAAWLLADRHEVTVFEKQPRFGGHAETVAVEVGGEEVFVDAGFEFFSPTLWPTFCRLLAALGVEARSYSARVAVFRPGQPDAFVLPPAFADLRRMAIGITARRAFDLGQLALVLGSVVPIMRARDTSATVGEVVDRLPLTPAFRDEFLFPYLLGGWCVEPEEFREFSAYNVLRYTFANLSARGAIPVREVVGGTGCYVRALLADVPRATMKASSTVDRVERAGSGFRVHEPDGAAHDFEHLVVATNARDARGIVRDLRVNDVRDQLARVEYFRTTIAIHEDRRVMPADERDWAIVNVRHDGRHAQTTVWKPWRSKAPVFRSWVTYDARLPEALHRTLQFDHPKVTRSYFDAQRALAAWQGRDRLWLAGMHTHDIDSHESALVSAVKVVEALDPSAPRLAALRAKR